MEINKQLFEDVLSGKLKGEFVLRNGNTYFSADLHRNYNKFRFTHPYIIGFLSYTPKGIFSIADTTSGFDIIDFITETNMKENELKITIPEGQEIDWQESAKQEKIVFKKKENTKPRSWEEYCNNFNGELFYFGNRNSIESVIASDGMSYMAKDYLPTKELAEAFLAMMQLMSLRQAWIGDWEPNWKSDAFKWCIIFRTYKIGVDYFYSSSHPLSFPTKEMAIDFMNTFKDLLNVAKPLI